MGAVLETEIEFWGLPRPALLGFRQTTCGQAQ